MSKTIDAVFENGVFKPLEKVEVKEHRKIKIILPLSLPFLIQAVFCPSCFIFLTAFSKIDVAT